MACYVDDPIWERWHGLSGHLIADSIEELKEMANTLSLSKKFFMDGALTPHYQLPAGRRDVAIAAGAIPLERPAFMAAVARINRSTPARREPPSHDRRRDKVDTGEPPPNQPLRS